MSEEAVSLIDNEPAHMGKAETAARVQVLYQTAGRCHENVH